MNIAQGVLTCIVGIIVLAIGKVAVHLLAGEIEGRLSQIADALLYLAVLRLPTELREQYRNEWGAELDEYYQNSADRPITKLWWTIWFPLTQLISGRKAALLASAVEPKLPWAMRTLGLDPVGGFPALALFALLTAATVGLLIDGGLTLTIGSAATQQIRGWGAVLIMAPSLLPLLELLRVMRGLDRWDKWHQLQSDGSTEK